MKRFIPAALAPVVLTGCVIGAHTPPAVPAQQFVTTLIQEQVPLIQQAQSELAQVSRVRLGPPKPSVVSTSLQTPTVQPNYGTPVLTGKTISAFKAIRYIGARPGSHTLVGAGRSQTLRGALQHIVPARWSFVFSRDLAPDIRKKIQWSGGDQWPFALDTFLLQQSLVALIDWPKQQISIAKKSPAFIPGATTSVPQTKSALTAPIPNSGTATKNATSNGRNPFSGKAQPFTPASVTTTTVKAIPLPVLRPHIWRIEAGSTLKDTLFNWASGETCSTPGVSNWTVAWQTSVNYRIDAPLQFEGNFSEALNSLFILYGKAKVPLYAGTKAQQCVLLVDDKEMR